MKKQTISDVMKLLAKRSVKARLGGRSKQERSEIMRAVSLERVKKMKWARKEAEKLSTG